MRKGTNDFFIDNEKTMWGTGESLTKLNLKAYLGKRVKDIQQNLDMNLITLAEAKIRADEIYRINNAEEFDL
ncbi:hypothetical protein [Bacillus atrophaeus]|uniref:hypothetical protein n=1 Tax=Bacillus atrophaeus TaxID=1452 RepID=UPI00227E7275|nr:hypothetical protein [Bacillus atrophaeus]MCY8466975.1 hypothetical protein [Bacillus atrophaeus]MCY8475684.1 hypothetical protein [Bacillus atrophaeus]MCY8856408.1 hypothetical protein [Bacillus atrophaeus]